MSDSAAKTGKLCYLQGDATVPNRLSEDTPVFIVHIVNNVGAWGRGFVVGLAKRYPRARQAYLEWYQKQQTQAVVPLDPNTATNFEAGTTEIPFKLGQVQLVEVERNVWVANLIGQHGLCGRNNPTPIRYIALREGLKTVAKLTQTYNANVQMPRIGAGLAGGDWDVISQIIEETLIKAQLTVTIFTL